MTLDPATLRAVAQIMRDSIDEIPLGPAQTGAFNATIGWADWCEQQATLADAEPPEDDEPHA